MSQENVEIVRQAFEAFSERDRDAWFSLCDDALEAVPSGDWPETATIRGPEAAWDFFLQAEEPWETGAYQLAEMIDADEDRVVAHQVRDMRGKESGVTVRYDYWAVFRVHAGKVIRVEYFGTRVGAVEAAGLAE
jgi:ketosteroid isomerase-like protein